jgi:hypothetical protein
MKNAKLILMALGLIFTALMAYVVVSFVVSIFWYLLLGGVVLLLSVGAYKFLAKSDNVPLLEENKPERELTSAQNVLEEYRRKLIKDKN